MPAGAPAGRVYAVWLAADVANAATGCKEAQLAAFHSVWSAYSDDGGTTWTDVPVYDAGPLHDGSEIFADLTLDNQGNPYVAFAMNIVNNFDIWVEASFDGGQTWNGSSTGAGQPYRANVDAGTHYFPAIAVGNPGQVDVAYLATPTLVPTTAYGKPTPNADANADWYLYLSQTTNLLTGALTWTSTRVTSKPMHHGDVCTLEIFCLAVNGNRNILDFIDNAVDPSGRFHVSYTDDRNFASGALVAANQTGGPTVGAGGH